VSSSGLEGRNIAWKYLKENFDRITGFVGTSSPALLAHAVTMASSGFNTAEAADEIEQFFKDKDITTIQRRVQQIIEGTRGNVILRDIVLGSDQFRQVIGA
jgi:aminopeptidase N